MRARIRLTIHSSPFTPPHSSRSPTPTGRLATLSSTPPTLTIDCHPDDLAEARADPVRGLAHVVAEVGVARVQDVQRAVLEDLQVRARHDGALLVLV